MLKKAVFGLDGWIEAFTGNMRTDDKHGMRLQAMLSFAPPKQDKPGEKSPSQPLCQCSSVNPSICSSTFCAFHYFFRVRVIPVAIRIAEIVCIPAAIVQVGVLLTCSSENAFASFSECFPPCFET